ncbi:MAG: hypothetical protein ACOY3I_07150 [Verrucomicrobiota bacterium]
MKTRILSFKILAGALLFCGMENLFAYEKVKEISGSKLTQITQQIEQHEKQNLEKDKQRKEHLMKIDKIMIERRKTALKLIKMGSLTSHGKKLYNADGSEMDFNNAGSEELKDQNGQDNEEDYKDYVMKTVDFVQEIVDKTGKIKIPTDFGGQNKDTPVWMIVEGPAPLGGSFRVRNHILRISSEKKSSFNKDSYPVEVEDMVYDAARAMLPTELMKGFDARAIVIQILKRYKIQRIADGIISRPTVDQDLAFARYSNLGGKEENSLLFWSDTLVMNGYMPLVGTSLNNTMLYGAKSIDMDNLASRGHSMAIEQWNRLQSEDKRVKNPFRGYAARVMPGLLEMSDQGRLTPYQSPTDEQLTEAMKLTKQLKALPSQNMRLRNASFHFAYPPQIVLTDSTPPKTKDVMLPQMQMEIYRNRMEMIKKRLMEIAKLKRENRLARTYVDKILQSNFQMEQEVKGLISSMVGDEQKCIPQLEMFRKDIDASVQSYRSFLSDLEFEHDKLLQKEWVVLEHAIQTKKEFVYILMDTAALRYRVNTEKENQGGSDDPG